MRFWKKWRKAGISVDDLKRAEMLEAYTCWLKNEKLSRKQKRLLKEFNNFPELQPLKQLIDFAHYRFEEKENVTLPLGSQERARERVMAEIWGTASADGLQPEFGYSPQGMGSETTEIMQVDPVLPKQQDTQQPLTSPEMLKRYDAIQTLSRLHVRFEQKDDEVYVTDLGSSNATYVDDKQVNTATAVEDGSTLKCGKISFKVTNIERS